MAKKKELVTPFPDNFLEDISKVCKKYGVVDVAIAGTREDKLIGAWDIDKPAPHELGGILRSTMNVARLYQSSRERLLQVMDKVRT